MYPEAGDLGAELHPIDMPYKPPPTVYAASAPEPASAVGGMTSWLILGGVVLVAGAIGWYVVKGK